MSFKIKIAGLEGSEILHMRPIKPWSYWDTAVAVAHFGAAAALTVIVGVDVILAAEQSGLAVPAEVIRGLGMAMLVIAGGESMDAYRKNIKAMNEVGDSFKDIPQLNDLRLEQLKENLEKSLREAGDQRSIRFVDFDDLNAVIGRANQTTTLQAMTMLALSDTDILVAVNVPFVLSRDNEAQFVFASHEVSHNYAPVVRMMAMWSALSTSNKVVAFIALGSAVALSNVPLAGLAVTSLCAVPILRQAYLRRLEFQSDRGAAYLTGDAEAVHRVLSNIEKHSDDKYKPRDLEIRDRRIYRYPRLYRVANRVFKSVDGIMAKVYATHPPMASRRRALKVLAKQQAHFKPD